MHDIGFVIFGCLTIPKYKEQVLDAYATWVQDALKSGCLVRFYVGDIPDNLDPGLAGLCINVNEGDNYLSAMFKQWRGLESMSVEPCKWYMTCGTDTFVNVKNALALLNKYDYTKNLIIGGAKGSETIDNSLVEYFTGGAGIFLTDSVLNNVLPKIPDFIPWWMSQTLTPKLKVIEETLEVKYITAACDLQLCYLCKEAEQISLPDILWGDRTYLGEGVNKDTLVTCHHMKHDDFYAYYRYISLVQQSVS
jgi:hypothetical protein